MQRGACANRRIERSDPLLRSPIRVDRLTHSDRLNHRQRFTNTCEGGNGKVQIFSRMGSHHAQA